MAHTQCCLHIKIELIESNFLLSTARLAKSPYSPVLWMKLLLQTDCISVETGEATREVNPRADFKSKKQESVIYFQIWPQCYSGCQSHFPTTNNYKTIQNIAEKKVKKT